MFERFRKKKPQASQGEPDQGVPESAAGASIGRAPAEVLAPFLEAPLPDAIDGLAFRVAMGGTDEADPVTGFERYGARLMDEAAASSIRAIAVEHPLETIRLDSTGLFWVRHDPSELSAEQAERILAAEAALNRLALIEPLAAEADQARAEEGQPQAITEAECSLLDWRLIRTVADGAPALLEGSAPDNGRLSQGEAQAPRGGNWDLLTRLAGYCEEVKLPFRLAYRVDADKRSGAVAVAFVAPAPSFFPASRWDEEAGQWASTASTRPQAAAAYCLRLAVLLAAAGLGASVGVSRVVVDAYEGGFDGPIVLSCEFERMAFMMRTLPALGRGELSAQGAEGSFEELLAVTAPSRWAAELGEEGRLMPVQPLDLGLPERRTPMEEDGQPLPEDLARLLRADAVRELDVMSRQDQGLIDRFNAIMEDSEDAPLLAIAQLEELATSLEEKDRAAMEALGEPLQPLYCQGAYARYLISLACDDESRRFFRVDDTSYVSRSTLTHLYLDLGDEEAALAQARACVALAPSSPSAYQDLITVLAAKRDYAAIVDVAKEALRLALSMDESSYLYYRLAFAFWRTDQRDLALACYLRVPPWAPVGEMAASERAELLEEMRGIDLEDFDRDAALRSGGVPLSPTKEAVGLLAETAIRFCEEGIFLAAGPGASALGNLQQDDALTAVAISLREGTRPSGS